MYIYIYIYININKGCGQLPSLCNRYNYHFLEKYPIT